MNRLEAYLRFPQIERLKEEESYKEDVFVRTEDKDYIPEKRSTKSTYVDQDLKK